MVETIHDKILMLKNEENHNWLQMQKIAKEIIESSKSYNFNEIVSCLSKHIPSLENKIEKNPLDKIITKK